jgi:hypothetical protein
VKSSSTRAESAMVVAQAADVDVDVNFDVNSDVDGDVPL